MLYDSMSIKISSDKCHFGHRGTLAGHAARVPSSMMLFDKVDDDGGNRGIGATIGGVGLPPGVGRRCLRQLDDMEMVRPSSLSSCRDAPYSRRSIFVMG